MTITMILEKVKNMKQNKICCGILRWLLPGIILTIATVNFSQAALVNGTVTTNFKLKELTGRELALKDFRGKIVVLVFGELYQENTLKAVKDLQKILSEKRSYRDAVEVLIIISKNIKPEEYQKFKGSFELTYPVLLDSDRNVYAQYEIIAIPTTFVVGRDGKIAERFPSYTISYYDQVYVELGYLLGEVEKSELESVLHPKVTPAKMNGKSERLLSFAENLKKRGLYENALNSYKEVLDKHPDLKEAHIGIGSIYLEKKEADMAESEFQKVLEKNPNDPEALKGILQVHMLRGDIDEKSDELLKQILATGYVDEDICYMMGEFYELKGDIKNAMKYYKKSCKQLMQQSR